MVVVVASFLNCHAPSFGVFNLIRSSWTRGSYISCAPLGRRCDWFNSIISEKCVRLEWEAVSKKCVNFGWTRFLLQQSQGVCSAAGQRGRDGTKKVRGKGQTGCCSDKDAGYEVGRVVKDEQQNGCKIQNNCFFPFKRRTLWRNFYSNWASCNHFTMLSHPLNRLCLKNINELDCGNWGLSEPNSHVITTGMFLHRSPQNSHYSPLLVTKCPSTPHPPVGLESNLMAVFPQTCCQWWGELTRIGRRWCKGQELVSPFNDHSCRFMWAESSSVSPHKADLHWGNYCCGRLSGAARPDDRREASSTEEKW